MSKNLPPVHPGEILRDEFMSEFGITPYKLAKAINVPRNRIEQIVRENRSITADTALRLARFFRTTPGFWMNLQSRFDTETAKNAMGQSLDAIEPISA